MAAISAQVDIRYDYQVNRSSLHRVDVSEKHSSASSSTLISKGLNQNSTIANKQMLVKMISILMFTNNVGAVKLKVKQRLNLQELSLIVFESDTTAFRDVWYEFQ